MQTIINNLKPRTSSETRPETLAKPLQPAKPSPSMPPANISDRDLRQATGRSSRAGPASDAQLSESKISETNTKQGAWAKVKDLTIYTAKAGAVIGGTLFVATGLGASKEILPVIIVAPALGFFLYNQNKRDLAPHSKLLSLNRDTSGDTLSIHLDNFIKLANLPESRFAIATSLVRDLRALLRDTLSNWDESKNGSIKAIIFSSHLFIQKLDDRSIIFRDPTNFCKRLGGTELPIIKSTLSHELSVNLLKRVVDFFRLIRNDSGGVIDGSTTSRLIDDIKAGLRGGIDGAKRWFKSEVKEIQHERANYTSGFSLDVSTPEKRKALLAKI